MLTAAPFSLYLGNPVEFRVEALNEINWGASSNTNSVKDVVRTRPLSPLTKVVEGALTSDIQIQISWSAVNDPETGLDDVTAYEVYWDNGSNGASWVLLVQEISSSLTFSFT